MILKNLYPNGKKRAVTFSYDDGVIEDRQLIEILNKYGLKGSFHLNSGYIGVGERKVTAEEIPTLYAGHEISCHSVTHPSIAMCPREEMVREVYNDRMNLEALAGYPVRGMSYPNGSFSDTVVDVLSACGIVYSRTTLATNNFALPTNWLTWHPTCHHNGDILNKLESFAAARSRLPLFYVWGHAYEFPRNNNWDMIEEFCKQVSTIEDAWFATNIEIYDYIQALNALQFSVDCKIVHNPSAISVWVSDGSTPVELKAGETYRK